MSSGREIKRPVTEKDIRQWEIGWTDMMVKIWKENMLNLGIFDTGRLYNRINGKVVNMEGMITITHQFMMYGIYVARGVGNGYRRGNSGKDDDNGLQFLDKFYRKEHKLGKPRHERDWFSRRYISSIKVLSEVERELYGNAYMGTLSNVVEAIFNDGTAKTVKGTNVTGTLKNF